MGAAHVGEVSVRWSQLLVVASLCALLTACGRAKPSGPVRTPNEAVDIAQRALRSAHLDEEVVSAERQDGAWVVTTRWRESSVAGHLVTIDAATGKARMERYRTLQLGPPSLPSASGGG
jgi:hypothetical protein